MLMVLPPLMARPVSALNRVNLVMGVAQRCNRCSIVRFSVAKRGLQVLVSMIAPERGDVRYT